MFAFLFRHLKGYRALVGFATLMTITQVGSDILLGFPIKFITDQIQGKAPPEALDRFIEWFDGLARGNRPTSVILFSVTALLVLSAVSALLSYLQRYLAAFIGHQLTARLRRTLFEHLERLSLDWHGKQKKGDLIQRITGDITNIEKLVTDGLVDLLAGLLTLLGVAVVMALVSLQFTLIALLILPPLALVVFAYTGSIKKAAKMASKATGQVANVATEDIGAITVVKAFTLEERESLRFQRYVHKNHAAGMRAGGLQAQFTPVVMLLVALGTALILGVGASVAVGIPFKLGPLEIESRSITVGTLVLFLGYLKMLYQPLRDLSKLTALATMANAGAERIQEVFDQAPEVLERAGVYSGPTRLRGAISFEQVVFGYTREQPILKGISLCIPAGRKVALVGLSGGGKTTLVKLIPRFYETGWGAVKIDGVDNRLYPLSVLRQNVSLVLQESVLFEGTIRENIAIGKPEATDQEIIAAAQQAHIHDTIARLPDGYQTTVREQGRNFSGGQRQRLAIARAILRDAPILILDEPTASLDVEAEAEVMRALDRLVYGRTVLMISHRLSTLGNVDEIIVLKDGRIVEQGTFKALKGRGGVFASLLAEQNRYNLERFDHESIIRPAMAMQALQAQPPALQLAPLQVAVPAPPAFQRAPALPAPIRPAIPAANGSEQPPPGKGIAQRAGAALEPAYLFIEMNGQLVGQRKLDRPILTIGRSTGSDVEIRSHQVSRLHARIVWENGAWFIEDASSLNGVMYQGRRIDRHALKKGDRVSLSSAVIVQYEAHR